MNRTEVEAAAKDALEIVTDATTAKIIWILAEAALVYPRALEKSIHHFGYSLSKEDLCRRFVEQAQAELEKERELASK